MSGCLSPLFSWRGAIASPESKLKPTVRHVALTLSLHMSERGDSCFPAVSTLMEETGLGDTAVRDALRTLVAEGWLTKEARFRADGSQTSSQYTATTPPTAVATPPSGVVTATAVATTTGGVSSSRHPSEGVTEGVTDASVSSIASQSKSTSACASSASRTKAPRPRDPLFDAMTEACGIDQSEMTRTLHGQASRAVAELRKAGATPDEVIRRADVYRGMYPGNTLTPAALTKHWAMIREQAAAPPTARNGVMAQALALRASKVAS